MRQAEPGGLGCLYALHLAIFDRPRSRIRIIGCSAGIVAVLALAALGGRWLWGEGFDYWVFEVPGHTPIVLAWGVFHGLEAWPFFAVGLLGGATLLRGSDPRRLLGPWLLWLLLLLGQTYTSGCAKGRHHLVRGP